MREVYKWSHREIEIQSSLEQRVTRSTFFSFFSFILFTLTTV